MPLKSKDHRYGSVAIAVHWVTAALIVVLFATGLQAAAQTDEAAKVALLRAHVPLGIGVLLLTTLRIAWRLLADRGRPRSPAEAPAWRRLFARAVHIGLYVVVVMTAVSGFATVAMSGAVPTIISGAARPDLGAVLPRAMYGIMPRLMLVLLAMHVGAALYHQFILRDRLLARMGLGRQRGAPRRQHVIPVAAPLLPLRRICDLQWLRLWRRERDRRWTSQLANPNAAAPIYHKKGSDPHEYDQSWRRLSDRRILRHRSRHGQSLAECGLSGVRNQPPRHGGEIRRHYYASL